MNTANSYRSGMLVVLLYDMKSEIKILRIKNYGGGSSASRMCRQQQTTTYLTSMPSICSCLGHHLPSAQLSP